MLFGKFSNVSRQYVVAFLWYFFPRFTVRFPLPVTTGSIPDEVLFAGKIVGVCSVVISRKYLYLFDTCIHFQENV